MNFLKGKSTRFLIAKKVEILNLVKKGKSRVKICKKFLLAPSPLQTFLRHEKKVEFENNRDSKHNAIRVFPRNELEQNLVKWVHMRENAQRAYGARKSHGVCKSYDSDKFCCVQRTMGQNQVILRHQKFTFPRARE